jgi:Zn-dependent protease with chaperone function
MSDAALSVDYFDGLHAQAVPVDLRIHEGVLHVHGPDVDLRIPVQGVRWPERTRHGARIAQLPDGGALHARQPVEWDHWAREHGLQDGWVVHIQQSWRLVGASTVVLVVLCVAAYLWGLPLASRAIIAATPRSVDQQVGELAMGAVEDEWLRPSRLPTAEQKRLRALFLRAQSQQDLANDQGAEVVPIQIHFRRSRIGPNAFALPDGSIVFTDELVQMLKGHDEVLLGVFGHELGHVRHRHTMRQLVQSGLLAAATSVALGDFSQVLAATPALMGHMAYSRDFEREADEASIGLMRANGIRPSVMNTLFSELAAYRRRPPPDDDEDDAKPGSNGRPGQPSSPENRGGRHEDRDPPSDTDTDTDTDTDEHGGFGIAFSSHPADAERIARFKEADRH